MYPFVETIRIEQSRAHNIMYHQQRLAATMARFFPGATVPTLTDALSQCHCPADKTWKVHVEYDGTGILLVRAEEYHIRTIRRLRLVYCDDISYAYKSADRHRLAALAAQRGDADEVVIVKNGLLTDTSYSNIALFDGQRWVTPRHPLLQGTMRQSLLDTGLLVERDIHDYEWGQYEKVSLVNAMMPLDKLTIPLHTGISS